MSSKYHHRQIDHNHTHPLPDLEFRYRKALPHGFNSFQPPPKHVPAAWKAEGGEPSQFDHPQQPLYQPDRYNRWEIPRAAESTRRTEIHAKLDRILAVLDKWENKWDTTDRRVRKLHAPPRPEPAPDGRERRSARQPWRDPPPLPLEDRPTTPRRPNARYRGSFHDQPHPRTIANNWDQVGWDDRRDHRQRQGFEEYSRGHQHLHNGRAEQPTYRSPQSDRLLSHGTAPLPADAPTRSDFTHQPQQSSKCIDSGRQHDLPNTPNLMVRSPCPAQLAAVRDYNEKLRIYRLEQAALLARVNALFEENIDDVNLAEDAPVSVAHDGGANLVVPNDESLEEIVKPDNTPLQVLVGTYDEKIGYLIVPTHSELKMKDEAETLLKENVVGYEDMTNLATSLSSRNIRETNIHSKSSRDIIESWCQSSVQGLIHYPQRRFTFDPGGDASALSVVPTLRTRWISTVGELIRSLDISII